MTGEGYEPIVEQAAWDACVAAREAYLEAKCLSP
jgi:hypothetical protein